MEKKIDLPVLKAVIESAKSAPTFPERLSRLLIFAFRDQNSVLEKTMYALLEGVCVDLGKDYEKSYPQLMAFLKNEEKFIKEIDKIEVGPIFSTVFYQTSETRWYDNSDAAGDFAKHGYNPCCEGKWGVRESPMFGYIYPATHTGFKSNRMSNIELEELGVPFIKV